MLVKAGVAIDSSVRANYDYSPQGGADYSRHPLHPYWASDAGRLLELPLTSPFWGVLRRQGPVVRRVTSALPSVHGALARTGLLERIPLTPEGVSVDEAIRGIDIALDDGLPLLVLSFHSPSLVPGKTPYVRNEDDLDQLYDWWRRVYGYLKLRGVAPVSIAQIMQNVVRR